MIKGATIGMMRMNKFKFWKFTVVLLVKYLCWLITISWGRFTTGKRVEASVFEGRVRCTTFHATWLQSYFL